MKRNRFLSMILCLGLALGLSAPAFAAQTVTVDPINVMVGGKDFLPADVNGKDVPVFAYNGTTYAPLRALAEAYGLNVGYNAEKNLATVDGTPSADFVGSKGTAPAITKRTDLTISPISIEVNGAVFQPKDVTGKAVPVFAYNGTTYAPLRALAEAYGLSVGYNAEKNLATVDFDAGSKKATNYDPIIDAYDLPFELGHPQYNVDEIRQMVEDDLTLDEAAEKLSTLADVVQYLHQKGYGAANGDIRADYSGVQWHRNRSPEFVFSENRGNCGGGSNLVNYLLRNDFDEQGYVQESANAGGHIYNYFKQGDTYYFIDFVQVVFHGTYSYRGEVVFETKDPQEFSDWYIDRNHSGEEDDNEHYLLLQYMYPCEGPHLPNGSDGDCRTVIGKPFMNILPAEIENSATILYTAEAKYAPRFRAAPPQGRWPADTPSEADTFVPETSDPDHSEETSSDAISLQLGDMTVQKGHGFGIGGGTHTATVSLNGAAVSDFTVSVEDPSLCTVRKTGAGTFELAKIKPGKTKLTVQCGDVVQSFSLELVGAAEPEPEKPAEPVMPNPSDGIVSEPGYEGWPYFMIDGEKVVTAISYLAKPGTYTVKLFSDGKQVPIFVKFESDNSAVGTAKDNGDGTFTLTAKKAGEVSIQVHHVTADGDERRTDLGVTCYTGKITNEPGVSLWWHNNTIRNGFGFGVGGQSIFVANVMLDGEKQTEYSVVSEDDSCDCTVQADGSLLIWKPKSGETWIKVTCKGQTARFRVSS